MKKAAPGQDAARRDESKRRFLTRHLYSFAIVFASLLPGHGPR
jgi:hypothetical protein